MADLLKLAREKSERLIGEAEEASALIESAEHLFREIPKHRELISVEFRDLDDFLTDAGTVVAVIKKITNQKIDEIKRISDFIKTGEMLLEFYKNEDRSYEEDRASKEVYVNKKLSDSDQLHWLTFGRKKSNDGNDAEN